MVLIEQLGDELGKEYVVINISRDVQFADEIKQRAMADNRVKIKAWGKTISLAVRLALEAVSEYLPGFKIGAVIIGTENGVEIPARHGPLHVDRDGGVHAEKQENTEIAEGKRVVKALSWMEILIEKP